MWAKKQQGRRGTWSDFIVTLRKMGHLTDRSCTLICLRACQNSEIVRGKKEEDDYYEGTKNVFVVVILSKNVLLC